MVLRCPQFMRMDSIVHNSVTLVVRIVPSVRNVCSIERLLHRIAIAVFSEKFKKLKFVYFPVINFHG